VAVYAIGDVQGCHEELLRLLECLRFEPSRDRLWFVGDLVNRGPRSLATLRFVRSLGDAAVVVLGNHDLHLLAIAAGCGRGLRRGDTLAEILAAPDREELLLWLRYRPLLHRDTAVGCTLVHAGLPPQWDLTLAARLAAEVETLLRADPARLFRDMYGDGPVRWSPALAGAERHRFVINCLTRLRYCSAAGDLLLELKGPPAAAPRGALPWFEVPGRQSAGERIVFGHWSALGYYAGVGAGEGAVSLDSGCVWGGTLTALRLDRAAAPVQLPCTAYQAIGAGPD
jgi:bis(5'-nucleosyl)-tetraphosphatase (symmetrical)